MTVRLNWSHPLIRSRIQVRFIWNELSKATAIYLCDFAWSTAFSFKRHPPEVSTDGRYLVQFIPDKAIHTLSFTSQSKSKHIGFWWWIGCNQFTLFSQLTSYTRSLCFSKLFFFFSWSFVPSINCISYECLLDIVSSEISLWRISNLCCGTFVKNDCKVWIYLNDGENKWQWTLRPSLSHQKKKKKLKIANRNTFHILSNPPRLLECLCE